MHHTCSTPLPVTDAVIRSIAFRAILESGEYPDNMREWQNLTPVKQMWDKCKTKLLLSYAAKVLSDKARDAVGKPFGGHAIVQALAHQVQAQVTNQMVDTLAVYLNNISAAATTTRSGTKLADHAASMSILVDTNASQAK